MITLQRKLKNILPYLGLTCLAIFVLFFYYKLDTNGYLRFSDAAKFADIAKNIVNGNGYVSNFSFFGEYIFRDAKGAFFSVSGTPPAMPYIIAIIFGIFGMSDLSVLFTSILFFLALVLLVYMLGSKLFNPLVGLIASITLLFNASFLDYATSGASEILFSLLGVLAVYLIFSKKKITNYLFFLTLFLLYLTRPQGFLFILVFLFTWISVQFSFKKSLLLSISSLLFLFFLDRLVLYPLSWKTNLYPIFTRGVQAFFQYSSSFAVSDALRGGIAQNINYIGLLKKAFYNLYNFYKLLPQIASPYIWSLFIIGIFKWNKDKNKNIFKFSVLLLVVGDFVLVSLTIPLFRYLHPVLPLVFVVSSATLVWLVTLVIETRWSLYKNYLPKFLKVKNRLVSLVSLVIIFLFVMGQTLGLIFLDSRFQSAMTNIGKPPIYVKLSKILKDNTSENSLILTNLDTWGTWYGDRKTVWFPLYPKQIYFKNLDGSPFDYIYLTSYLMNDENYYMGKEWREIFNNPNDPNKWQCEGCSFIRENYKLKAIYEIDSQTNYENQASKAILLKKNN